MIAENLLSNTIVPLRTSDKGRDALTIMNLFSVKHLPIVDGTRFLGVIAEEEILMNNVEEPIGTYRLSLDRAYVHPHDHIYEVMRILAEQNLTVVAVIDEKNDYLGLISQDEILRYFATTGAFAEPGSVLVLSVTKRDYSLAEISRIVESEHGIILSSFINSYPDSQKLDVTLKLNTENIQNIIASLERFGYEVKGMFSENEYLDTLRERYDSLMSYLNV
jgi:CBS domain-containing protein